MARALINNITFSVDKLFDGKAFLNNVLVTIESGILKSIKANVDKAAVHLEGLLSAGFIDLQVNGGGGKLFNQTPDLETIKTIGDAHRQFGTTALLPTLITDSKQKMHQAADAIALAIEQQIPGVVGIHFEGPHLSVEKKGVHQAGMIRDLTREEMALYCRKDIGKVLVTLAPETVSTQSITDLVANDVVVCLGHSNGTSEQTIAALNAGATGFTHLFNAMSPLNSREPGMVGAALADKNSWCGIIVDGEHIHPVSMKAALNAKEKMFLVTDAMPTVGSEDDSFELYGSRISRTENKLTNEEGRLAGSNLNMAQAVKNCQSLVSLELAQSLNMASINPAEFIGLSKQLGSLNVGKQADMVLLDSAGNVQSCWVAGNQLV